MIGKTGHRFSEKDHAPLKAVFRKDNAPLKFMIWKKLVPDPRSGMDTGFPSLRRNEPAVWKFLATPLRRL
jgi:hypothetical protein